MSCIAFYTCSPLRDHPGSEQVQGFFDMLPEVFAEADEEAGCLGHIREKPLGWPLSAQDWGRWGEYRIPSFYADGPQERARRVTATISIWVDVDAVRRFAYNGAHGAALENRADWFEATEYPQYVMWWIEDGVTPTWRDCACKLEALNENGATQDAFDFANVYPAP